MALYERDGELAALRDVVDQGGLVVIEGGVGMGKTALLAIETSLGTDGRDAAHRRAAQLLDRDEAPPGRIAAHLVRVQPTGEPWVVSRLREVADAAMRSGAPWLAAELLGRALAEPPPVAARVAVLRELARADASAGHTTACGWLEQALALTTNRRERAEIALEVAEVHAASFRWVDAVDLIERALAELGDENPDLAARLEAQLAVAGLHDARRASRVAPVLGQLTRHHPTDAPSEALAVGQAMASVLAGRPAHEAATLLEAAQASATSVESWDTRAALLWTLVTTERFESVDTALQSVLGDVHRSGSARGLIVVYSTLGLLKLRLGALPEADAAARVALRVLLDGDFAPGLPFASTVLSEVALEAGDLEQAEALLDLVPEKDWMAGIGTVLIPAARGRLRLAQSRPAEALADFQICASMFGPAIWGIELRDVGYLHARSGAAQALLQLGRRDEACSVAMSELADVRQFGTPRALGVAARAAGLATDGSPGIELLAESVAALQRSPALLERAKSLVELGAAQQPVTGKINWVQIDLGNDDHDHFIDPDERLRVAMARQ